MLSSIFKSEFFKNVATVMSGVAIAQAVTLLAMPFLARLYTPHDFGIWALFISIVNIIGSISTARFEMAIILPKKNDDAVNLLASSVIISFLVSFLSLVVLVVFYKGILSYFENPEIGPYLFLAPLAIFFQGVYQAFNYWSIRNKRFKRNALGSASRSITTAGGQLLLGFAKTGATGLILGTILGFFVSMMVLIWGFFNKLRSYFRQINIKKIKSNISTYKNYPLINAPHAFVGKFQESGIIFFIKSFINVSIVGQYSIAMRVLTAPAGLLAKSVDQVFFEKANKQYNEGQSLKAMMYEIHKKIFLIGFPFFLILLVFAPQLFEFIFSSEYREAGVIAAILAPWLFLNLIASSTQSLFLILGKLKQVFAFSLIDISLRIIALYIGYVHNDYKIAFIYMSIFCSIFIIATLIWAYKIAGQTLNKNK